MVDCTREQLQLFIIMEKWQKKTVKKLAVLAVAPMKGQNSTKTRTSIEHYTWMIPCLRGKLRFRGHFSTLQLTTVLRISRRRSLLVLAWDFELFFVANLYGDRIMW